MLVRYWRAARIRAGLVLYKLRKPPGRHRAPKRQAIPSAPVAALPAAPAPVADTVPMRVVLLDPEATTTTELPQPRLYRATEND